MKAYFFFLFLLSVLFFCVAAPLYFTQIEFVATTLILEAGGESDPRAMYAVNEVIHERAKLRGLSPKGVCLQPKQFSCWNSPCIDSIICRAKSHPKYKQAMLIAMKPRTNYTLGADHFERYDITPYWVSSMTKTVQIGNHIFYRSK
jgi:spore germination cell wall hydrolase CwlJ-like protein